MQQWHALPLCLGFVFSTFPFLFCGARGDDGESSSSCSYPNSTPFEEWDRRLILLFGQVSCLLFALPWALMGVACFLQTVDMDNRLMQELKPYKNDGETIDGWLSDDTGNANDTKSQFRLQYQYNTSTIRKTIRVTEDKDKERLLKLPKSLDSATSIPLVILPPNECSAIAQSWLENQLQERTCLKRRCVHLAATIYGIGIYFAIAKVFMVEDTRNTIILFGCLFLIIPVVHLYLLHRHDNFVQGYLHRPSHEVVYAGVNLNPPRRLAAYTAIPLDQSS